MTKLENWGFITRTSPYQPPESGLISVNGDVYGDPRFDDGTPITTGTTLFFDSTTMEMHTRRTKYILGTPSIGFQQYMDDSNISIEEFAVDKREDS